jgi:hypothetical protein
MPGLDAVDESLLHHHTENPVGSRGMQPSLGSEPLQVHGLLARREGVQEIHHALDDLDGGFGGVLGHGSFGKGHTGF